MIGTLLLLFCWAGIYITGIVPLGWIKPIQQATLALSLLVVPAGVFAGKSGSRWWYVIALAGAGTAIVFVAAIAV